MKLTDLRKFIPLMNLAKITASMCSHSCRGVFQDMFTLLRPKPGMSSKHTVKCCFHKDFTIFTQPQELMMRPP